MTEIIIISCIAKNGVIGKNNDIPWRIKEDFKHFKDITMGHPCIMGEKTYRSLPENAKPLPGRENIVLTFDKEYKPEGVTVMYSFDDALEYCRKKGVSKAFITGGASIYKLGLTVADKLELTRLHKEFDGDIYFPEINYDEWKLINKDDKTDPVHGNFSFMTYERIRG